jgi:nicotinamide-nucleotide amidase
MIVEVVAVGTELLLGQIVNGNAASIGRMLAEEGFDAHHQVVVGDNIERIADALQIAINRAEAVIITGGIGPTQDDVTRDALARALDRRMLFSEDYAESLRVRFAASGREMPASNLRQAEYPDGAELLANPKGSAPGLAVTHQGKHLFVVPGVPEEMEQVLRSEVLPRLRSASGSSSTLVSRILRSWGRPESQVAEMLDDLYRSTNPSIAFLASAGEIKIRITAKATDREMALALISPVEAEVRRRMGQAVFGADDETIERVLLSELGSRGWTIGTAESATGGLVAFRLTSVPGSSEVFRGSLVSYAEDLKVKLLGVADLSLGVVSEETAKAMARGAQDLLSVDVAVSVTGSAGPGSLEQAPGTMVIGVATPEDCAARTLILPGDRERVRSYAATSALQLARLAILGDWWTR